MLTALQRGTGWSTGMLSWLAHYAWKSLKFRAEVSKISKWPKSHPLQQKLQSLASARCRKAIPAMIVPWDLRAATDQIPLRISKPAWKKARMYNGAAWAPATDVTCFKPPTGLAFTRVWAWNNLLIPTQGSGSQGLGLQVGWLSPYWWWGKPTRVTVWVHGQGQPAE